MTTPTIRTARPDDRPFLAWVMRTAATSHLPTCVWDVLFGLPAEHVDELLLSLLGSARTHWCHLDRFWVAEVNGEPAGAMTGFDTGEEGNPALEAEIFALLAGLDLPDGALEALLTRATALARATPPNLDASWGVENVAVAAGFRGAGVVDALLQHVLGVGRDRGYQQAQVLCLNGNERAERTWKRNGFGLVTDYRDVSFEQTYGTPGLRLHAQAL